MIIAGRYSFNGGKEAVEARYSGLYKEVVSAIAAVDANQFKTKQSEEKTMRGRMLYSPVDLNAAMKAEMLREGWVSHRVKCEYPTSIYEPGYTPKGPNRSAFREMDFVKEKLGVEVQFGKYAFMVYNVSAKMTIFRNRGIIDTGIEVVPVKAFADQMSTGVSYYEQFIWDLEQRGVSNIDIPVLILGIDADQNYLQESLSTEVQGNRSRRDGARPGPKPST